MAQLKAIQDKLLTQASSMYVPQGYISEMLLPSIGVKESTGKLAKYGNQHLRIENSYKGGRGKYRRVESITRSTDTYTIQGHGLEALVTKDDYRNVQDPYDAEADETIGLTTHLWLEKEKSLADQLGNTSVLTQNTTLSGTDQYSDYLNSDPLDDFDTARLAVRDGCGMLPDTAVMSYKVYSKLRYHPQILDSLGYKENRPGGLRVDELADAMDVKRILIGEAMYNNAKEGATDSLTDVWGKNIIFSVSPERAAVRQVSLGYRVQFEGQAPRKVYKWAVNNPPESNAILVEDEYDMFLSNVNAAYLLKDAIA